MEKKVKLIEKEVGGRGRPKLPKPVQQKMKLENGGRKRKKCERGKVLQNSWTGIGRVLRRAEE